MRIKLTKRLQYSTLSQKKKERKRKAKNRTTVSLSSRQTLEYISTTICMPVNINKVCGLASLSPKRRLSFSENFTEILTNKSSVI